MLPRNFFVTSGTGLSGTSLLNAFDNALFDAGIAQCNLVKVSSILPDNCFEIDFQQINPGTITHCVMSRIEGGPGQVISAGVMWAHCISDTGEKYGLVAEHSGNFGLERLETGLQAHIGEMAGARSMTVEDVGLRVAHLQDIPKGQGGVALACLVYVF